MNGSESTEYPQGIKENMISNSHHTLKLIVNDCWSIYGKNTKLPGDNLGKYNHNLEIRFLIRIQKALTLKENTDKLDYIITKNFSS